MPMLWFKPFIALFLACGLARATHPTSIGRPSSPPLNRVAARQFALQLQEVIVRVMQRYIRPVEPTVLAEAALNGLYEAAQVPIPTTLHADVRTVIDKEGHYLSLFTRIREDLGNPPSLRGDKAIRASLKGLTNALDPFCAVLNQEEGSSTDRSEMKSGFGMTMVDSTTLGSLVVKSVALGGPAQRAGIRPGDQITQFTGQPPNARMTDPAYFSNLERVEFTVIHPGTPGARKIVLQSESFDPETVTGVTRRYDNSWEYFLSPEHGIAQVRILAFDAGTVDELARVLKHLKEQNLRGLILDLRWCPGGYLDPSREVAGLFLGDYNPAFFVLPTPANTMALADVHLDDHCNNASVWYRDGEPDRGSKHLPGSYPNLPIIVMVNGETSGGAELVAAVLQDNRRARISGQRTRGKGTVQRYFKLTGEEAGMQLTVPIPGVTFKLSTGMLLRPSGKNLNRLPDSKPTDDWGVRPDLDLEYRVSAELDHRLRDWWQWQNLRPGTSNESLPLDDPTNDPQRQAALRTLIDMVK